MAKENTNEQLLRPMEQKSIVDRITARLIDAIMNGRLKPGERIPTETELSDSIGVGRNSVREAIKALVAMGVLNIRRAEGTFVADGFSERMLDPIVYGMILEGGSTPAVLELRHVFDVGAMELAIEKATENDLANLRKSLSFMEKTIRENPTTQALMMADIAFHDELQHIANNTLLEKISFVVERVARPTREKTVALFIEKGELKDMLQLHINMYNVVEKRDRAHIVDAINDHYLYWKDMFNEE